MNEEFESKEAHLNLTKEYTEKKLQYIEHEELKADRKLMVEALIIKLMKMHKVLTLEDLYEDITPLIEERGFNFNQKFVHNCFQGLITKNYIRDLKDSSFSYIAS